MSSMTQVRVSCSTMSRSFVQTHSPPHTSRQPQRIPPSPHIPLHPYIPPHPATSQTTRLRTPPFALHPSIFPPHPIRTYVFPPSPIRTCTPPHPLSLGHDGIRRGQVWDASHYIQMSFRPHPYHSHPYVRTPCVHIDLSPRHSPPASHHFLLTPPHRPRLSPRHRATLPLRTYRRLIPPHQSMHVRTYTMSRASLNIAATCSVQLKRCSASCGFGSHR